MSRTIVIRRLTAVIALLAVLCLAMPAAAAGARQHPPRTPAVHTPGLLDQVLSWLGAFLPGSPGHQGRTGGMEKVTTSIPVGSVDGLGPFTNDSDRGAQIDPNGHQ
jgi:hypothetical protein